MQGDVREHYGAAVAAAVSSVVTPASLQLSSAGAADPTDVAELKQRIEE